MFGAHLLFAEVQSAERGGSVPASSVRLTVHDAAFKHTQQIERHVNKEAVASWDSDVCRRDMTPKTNVLQRWRFIYYSS
jgi:hypothetical protein